MGKAKKKAARDRAPKTLLKRRQSNAKTPPDQSSIIGQILSGQSSPSTLFQPSDRILLVGEGDFSFSKALLDYYNCTSLVATSYDSRPVAIAKYPTALSNIEALEAGGETGPKVLFEVDAKKLGTSRVGSGGKQIKKGGFDRIVFNFPHVGGKSTDVARQIRHNQELLLGFLKASSSILAPVGIVVVTLFEGKPYEDWDLRGLAKNAGLKSLRSFRFESHKYAGYQHARTLGNIEGGGGWRGEDRPARTYLLGSNKDDTLSGEKDGGASAGATGSNSQPIINKRDPLTKKRKRAQTDSESD